MKNFFEYILEPPAVHMVGDGFRVHTILPSQLVPPERTSPFYLLDYNPPWQIPPGETPKGVGVHPHRGFETVTFALQGSVAHHDSRGNAGIIGAGDVQWMTAGSGILHKEYHEKRFSQTGGVLQMVQLWVNLPAKHKMTTPAYQALSADQMGYFDLPDGNGTLTVVAGGVNGCIGPARTFSTMQVFLLHLAPGGSFEFPIQNGFNTCLLVLDGEVQGGDVPIATHRLAILSQSAPTMHISSAQGAACLVLSGEPLREPIAQYGPFLMNTRAEIMQAIDDFNNGLFGELED